MEQNQKKKMNKKSLISLVACVVVVAACALCTVGVLISRNFGSGKEASKTEEIVIKENAKGEMLATDEASLRKLLKEDKTYTIAIENDIYVTEALKVNGTKTLVGDKSIIMDLNTKAKGKVLSVSSDAKLVLDGATIDGNGVASGIAVAYDGTLECLSGNIVYPMPYGIVTEGKVTIDDITIDRSMHTGIYVETGGELYMSGGQITNCIQTGIATSTKAYAKVSENAVITKSAGSLFYNYGTLDITGGVYSESYSNCIYNKGELNIISESEKVVEFFNSGKSVISSVAGTTVNIDGLYVHDITAHAMNLEKDSVADVKNVLVENTGKSCFYANDSKLTMKDVEIKDAKTVCLNLVNKSKVELEDITISNGGYRGIVNDSATVTMKNITIDTMVGAGIITIGDQSVTTIEKAKISKVGKSGIGVTGGTVTAKNIEITDAAGTSIYTVTGKSKTTIDGAKLVNSGKSAIGVSIGTLTAKNVEINGTGTANTGVYIQKDAKLTLTNAIIKGANKHGIANYFGTAELNNVSIEAPKNAGILNQGTLTGEKVTINKSGSRAMSLTDASITNVKGLVINESKKQSVYVHGVTKAYFTDFNIDKSGQSAFRITKSTDVLLKAGKITNANGDGIWVSEDAKMKVQDTVITAPTKYGVEVYGTAEVTAVGVTVNNARAGFVNNGGTINGKTVAVNDSTSRSVNLIGKSTTNIDGLTVKNAGDQAVYVDDTTKVVLKNFVIDKTKSAAIRVANSKNVSIKDGTIKNAGTDGVYAGKDAAIKVEAVTITDIAGYGLYAETGNLTAVNVSVKNAKAGIVNKGGILGGTTVNVEDTTSRGANLIEGGTTTITGLTVKNAGDQGVFVENSKVKLDTFTVDKAKSAALSLGQSDAEKLDEKSVENVTLTNGTITNSGSTGIYIAKTATANATGVTVQSAGQHGIQNAGGKLIGTTLTINQSANRALTMSAGSEADVNGLNITGTGNQAVYVDGGTESKISVAGFNISDSTEAAVRIMNTKDVKLTEGTVNATTYGIAISGTEETPASATAEDVRIIRQEGNANYLVWIIKNSSFTLQNGEGTEGEKQSLLNGQDKPGIGVWIESAGSFNLKGGKIANSKGNTSEGAGVYVCEGASFVMDGGVIENNETTNTSGGVAARGAFTLNDGIIQNNKGSKGAGVMVRATGTFTMNGGTISGNVADVEGGGVYIQSSTADTYIKGGSITGNTSSNGGGIYVNSTKTIYVSNVTISANTAAGKGAGAYLAKGTLEMTSGSIENHGTVQTPNATEGAGVYVASGTKFNLKGSSTIANNHTTANGAGVATYGTFNMSGTSSIQNNTTTAVGGGVYNGGGKYTMNNSSQQTLYQNKAQNGAGVYVAAGEFLMKNGIISTNTSTADGAGVWLNENIGMEMWAGKIVSNKSSGNGGAIAGIGNNALTLTGGEISGNTGKTVQGIFLSYVTKGTQVTMNVAFNMGQNDIRFNNIKNDNPILKFVGGSTLSNYTATNKLQIGLHNSSNTASTEFECESEAAASAIVELLNSNNTSEKNNNHKWTFKVEGKKIIATK